MYKKHKYNNGVREILLFGKVFFRYSNKESILKQIIYSLQLLNIDKKHKRTIKILKNKYKNKEKINFAFFVINNAMNPSLPLINKLKNSNIFNPFIVVVPYTAFETEKMIEEFKKTYEYINKKFDNIEIIKGYDIQRDAYIDISNITDIACITTPYGLVMNELHRASYLYSKNVLPFYISYTSLSKDYYGIDCILSQDEMKYMWKVFVDTEYVLRLAKHRLVYSLKNMVSSGYVKMDGLHKMTRVCDSEYRKTIILAPHHSIGDTVPNVMLSTFLKFSDLYLKLPMIYKDIKFIFRPHTFLKIRLKDDKYWGEQKTDEYFQKMASYKNVEYQDGGDYLQSFINSDGIITDCGSFLMEYLYTDNPGCYILRNDETTEKMFNSFGKKCLEQYYIAFNEYDIINYIDDVILNENDVKKIARIEFATKEVKFNYPKVVDFILKHITNSIENEV